MELVILGQKRIKNGKTIYRTYYNHAYEKTPKRYVEKGQTITTLISPFPFDIFSTLDLTDEADSFKQYEPCYLSVDAAITQREMNKMGSGNKSSYSFYNRKMTFLGECETPFQYALSQYNKYRKLGTWDLVTWLPHQETRSQAEFEAMSEIFEIDYANSVLYDNEQCISFDKYIIPYLPQLVDKPGVRFGYNGYFRTDIETLCAIDTLTVDQLLTFVQNETCDLNVLLPFWTKHPMLGLDWFKAQLSDLNSCPSRLLLGEAYTMYDKALDLDWQALFDWRYDSLQRSDHRDLTAFFNSPSIEKKYQEEEKAYDDYVIERENEASDDYDDDDDYYYDDDYDDWYNDDDEVYPPVDKRAVYLNYYIRPFHKVLSQDDFKKKFPEVPQVVWDRLKDA